MSQSGLKTEAVRGVIWTAISKFSVQGLLLITTVILARVLVPEDFGIIGMAAIITVAIGIVTDQGLAAAIIQRAELHKRHLSSTFWGGVALGCALFVLSIATSGYIARYYRNDLVKPVVNVLAAGFVIGSLGMVQKAMLKRALDFRRLAWIEIIGVIGNAVVSIGMALAGFGVWSIVFGLLLRNMVVTILLWGAVPWKPTCAFHWTSFRELFSFSANVLGNDIMLYVNFNVPYVVIGRLLGSTMLGFFTVAFNLVTLPIYSFASIVSKVAFPAFSRVQEDLEVIRRGYTQSLTYISAITFPLLVGLMIVAPEFVRVVFGAKWSEAILPVQLLCPMAVLRSVGTTRGALFQARGRSDIELKWNVLYFVPFTLAVYAGSNYGLHGATAAYTGIFLIGFPVIQYITNRLIDLQAGRYFKSLLPTSASTVVMGTAVLAAKYLLRRTFAAGDLCLLIVSVLIGGAAYVCTLYRIDRVILSDLVTMLMKRRITRTAFTQV